MKYDLEEILTNNKRLIDKSKGYMDNIIDFEHNSNHVQDVLSFLFKLMENVNEKFNAEVCIISAYWHDVGRNRQRDDHERISAEILSEEMQKLGYDESFITMCCEAILFHKWNMHPKTIEGKIVKDADKLAWLGKKRWEICLENKQKLDEIINLLPKLRNEILFFDYSKKLYDEAVIDILTLIYEMKIKMLT